MAKEYTIRKVLPSEQEGPAMLARFEDMWSASEKKSTKLDFAKATGIQMFVEREPVVEEEDEEDRLKLEEEAAKVARGVKKARWKKEGEWQWVLQDPEGKKSEGREGIKLIGRRDGNHDTTAAEAASALGASGASASSSSASSSSAPTYQPSKAPPSASQLSEMNKGARYAIMMQTGPDDIVMVPLGQWYKFKPPTLFSSSNAAEIEQKIGLIDTRKELETGAQGNRRKLLERFKKEVWPPRDGCRCHVAPSNRQRPHPDTFPHLARPCNLFVQPRTTPITRSLVR